jgi:hypothetical protein
MSTRFSTVCSPALEPKRRLRLQAAALVFFSLTSGVAIAADPLESISEQVAPDTTAKPPALDPVTEVVEGDALTQIRISAIAFQNPKDLGQALSGVIGAFLKRDRLKDALVDLSVVNDPVWRAYALLQFAEYRFERGETEAASWLVKQANALTRKITAQPDESMVLTLVSQREAEHGDYAAARQTAARMVAPERRIARYIELAEMQATETNKRVAAGGAESLRIAFADVKKSTLRKEERIRLLLELADRATTFGYRDLAQKMLDYCHGLKPDGAAGDGVPVIADLAAAMVRAGDRGRAMDIVRSLQSDVRRGYTLASVARAFAESGSIEGAVPLFYLAIQDADAQEKGAVRVNLFTHLVKEQTHAGRLADAFTTAGKITEPEAQRSALFAMAEILFDQGKPSEAVKIADYTPDPGMRAEVLGRAATSHIDHGDMKQAATLLRKAVEPTGAKPNAATLASGLPLLFEASYAMKKGTERDKILASARKLLELMPDDPAKVPVITRIARAEMRGQDKDAADRSLGMAWRIAWLNKDKAFFPELLRDIAMTQLNVGELLLAFDTAARISETPVADVEELESLSKGQDSPRISALTAVAIAAAQRGEGQLALRAARTIVDPGGRASAYRQIALAFPVENQQAKLGIGSVPMHPETPSPQKISPAVEGAPVPAAR